jgi:dihydromonapterin reductase/dihydrofolate reductase
MQLASKLHNAVVITGAGQRIGYHLAKQYLVQTAYPVVFSYRTLRPGVKELIELGAIGFQADFNQPDAITQFIAQIDSHCASLRGLIHNASVWLDDQQADSFAQQMRLHVELPYQLNQGLAMLLKQSKVGADIISISDAKVAKGSAHQVSYLASKAALQSMTRSFALKLAPQVKVNDIAPALIMFNQGDDEDYRQQRLLQNLLPIEPGPDVVWQTVHYLMQNAYITGKVIQLDGGQDLI